MKKSFRGKLADSTIQQIRLSSNNGLTGYRIIKFQGISSTPGVTAGSEHVLQVFTTRNDETGSERSVSGEINFNDPTLLGVVYVTEDSAGVGRVGDIIIFDNMVFNQDIYITHEDVSTANKSCNFYLELEQLKLSNNEATVATLKDMRSGPDTNFKV